jgi:predicted glycosyltransferase
VTTDCWPRTVRDLSPPVIPQSLHTVFRNHLYYRIKPLVPTSVRMPVRRWFAQSKRKDVGNVWPILPGSEKPPQDWAGWPEGKQFALVLTHDVEGQTGLAKCRQLMEVEQKLGFRSSFNFVPEGEYVAPRALHEELRGNGFEVGVHDLRHDGRLYRSRNQFRQSASRINEYLKDWGAVGFRSGFMLHKLDWLHDLNIQYDASTFDTDPFEPQPEGRDTIFPFWVPRSPFLARSPGGGASATGGVSRADSPLVPRHPSPVAPGGYIELPYTLPQDSTLFLLLGERSIDVWKKKIDWIATHGGMVLLDTHPDYMAMNGTSRKAWEYPISLYEELLRHVRSNYAGDYWHALPREVAHRVRTARVAARPPAATVSTPVIAQPARKPNLWIDLDNTPHVPFFEPILEELTARGFPVLVTARDAFQVCDLADKIGLPYIKIGRHHGKHRLVKGAGLAYRSLQLAPLVLREKPALAISHGARSQILLSNCLGIPTILIEDYEYSQFPLMMRPGWVMAPAVIPDRSLCVRPERIRKYPGIKEDVYAWKLQPDPNVLTELGLSEADTVVTVRPPATEAHYHNPESEKLLEAFMDRACDTPHVKVVLLPRNKKQVESLRGRWPRWFAEGKTIVPGVALDGLNLIWHSDLVVSGGGTMNREAAALGVPVYSIFRGTIGAVDRQLKAEGRLVLVESVQDVHREIKLVKRPRKSVAEVTSRRTLQSIVDAIQQIAEEIAR